MVEFCQTLAQAAGTFLNPGMGLLMLMSLKPVWKRTFEKWW